MSKKSLVFLILSICLKLLSVDMGSNIFCREPFQTFWISGISKLFQEHCFGFIWCKNSINAVLAQDMPNYARLLPEPIV